MKKLLLSTLLFSYALMTYSADVLIPKSKCTNLDIRTKMNSEMKQHFSTPRSQGTIGWCYGFTSADMLSAELKKPISAIHVSSILNKNINNNFFLRANENFNRSRRSSNKFKEVYEGGFADRALKYVSKEKYLCLESALPFDLNYYDETLDIIQGLENYKEAVRSNKQPSKNSCKSIKHAQQSLFQNMSINEIQSILLKDNMNKSLTNLINKNCKGKMVAVKKFNVMSFVKPKMGRVNRSISYSKRKADFDKDKRKYFERIGNILSSGKPMSISYDISSIKDSSGLHSSLLTGRRWKNGKCQFKLRNTWGKHCSPYDKNKIEECIVKEGSYWVSDKKFFEMGLRVDYID